MRFQHLEYEQTQIVAFVSFFNFVATVDGIDVFIDESNRLMQIIVEI